MKSEQQEDEEECPSKSAKAEVTPAVLSHSATVNAGQPCELDMALRLREAAAWRRALKQSRRLPKAGQDDQEYREAQRKQKKFLKLIKIQEHANGHALVVETHADKLTDLCPADMEQFAKVFLAITMSETDGVPNNVMGIVRNGAHILPNFFEYLAHSHPELLINVGSLTSRQEVKTMTVKEYARRVRSTYKQGIFSAGPMLALTMVDTKHEERGGYFPDFLDFLERSPFIAPVLPWGRLSSLPDMDRRKSNDGPIMWIRPGEQLVSCETAQKHLDHSKRLKKDMETARLAYSQRVRIREQRAVLFEDRTHCHADFVDGGLDRKPTAAVGVLKAIHGNTRPNTRRIVKEALCFHAANLEQVVSLLNMDIFEPPMSQCREWVDVAKLNQLHQQGIQYSQRGESVKMFHCALAALIALLAIAGIQGHALHGESSEFAYHDVKKTMLLENRPPKTSRTNHKVDGITVQMIPQLPMDTTDSKLCAECKVVVAEIADTLKDQKTVDRYKRALKLLCMMTVQSAAECEAFIDGLDMVLDNLKDHLNDPDKACHELHLCDTAEPNLFSRVLLMWLKSFNFEAQAIRSGNTVDLLCDECMFMANELVTILSDPAYQKSLQDLAKRLCGIVPQVKHECENAIDSYGPALFEDLLDYMANPKPFCERVGMCKPAELAWAPLVPLMPATPVDLSVARQEENDECPLRRLKVANGVPAVCLVCQYGMQAALERLRSEEFLNTLEDTVLSFCSSIPSEWSYSCADWVSTYFRPSMLTVIAEVNPKKVCNSLGVCTMADRFQLLKMTVTERRAATCEACKMVVDFMRAELESPAYQQQVVDEISRFCTTLPFESATKAYCESIVRTYTAYFMEDVLAFLLKPTRICTCRVSADKIVKQMKQLCSKLSERDVCGRVATVPMGCRHSKRPKVVYEIPNFSYGGRENVWKVGWNMDDRELEGIRWDKRQLLFNGDTLELRRCRHVSKDPTSDDDVIIKVDNIRTVDRYWINTEHEKQRCTEITLKSEDDYWEPRSIILLPLQDDYSDLLITSLCIAAKHKRKISNATAQIDSSEVSAEGQKELTALKEANKSNEMPAVVAESQIMEERCTSELYTADQADSIGEVQTVRDRDELGHKVCLPDETDSKAGTGPEQSGGVGRRPQISTYEYSEFSNSSEENSKMPIQTEPSEEPSPPPPPQSTIHDSPSYDGKDSEEGCPQSSISADSLQKCAKEDDITGIFRCRLVYIPHDGFLTMNV